MKRVDTVFEIGNWPALALLMATTLIFAPGCTTLNMKSIEIVSTPNVNADTAVAVDVVFIFDDKLVDTLPAVTARAWFREKPTYLARYPKLLLVSHHELVPIDSATIKPGSLKAGSAPAAKKARAVLLFANYLEENIAYTLDISSFKNPIITLEKTMVSVHERSDQVK
jgi:type VI secretion system protein